MGWVGLGLGRLAWFFWWGAAIAGLTSDESRGTQSNL